MDFIESSSVQTNHAEFAAAAGCLRSLVESHAEEIVIQKHLESHLYLVSQQFAHCHHVAPNFSFGGKLFADFLCLDWPSSWPHWIALEIEAPRKRIMTKTGRRTAALEHALQQVRDWREFIKNNLDFVNRPLAKGGLGLEHAEPNMMGYVFIGRRPEDPNEIDRLNVLRRQIADSDNIYVFTWDGIVERAEERARLFRGIDRGIIIDLGDGNPISLRPIDDKKTL